VTKRLLWLSTGFGLGVVASRRARQRAAQLAPGGIAERVRGRVRAAVDEGRREMHQREATLRTVLAAPGDRDDGQ
jgi:hypothetical protein